MKKIVTYRTAKGSNLFEEELTAVKLSKLGNPLNQLQGLVDFEMFRSALEEVLLSTE